MALLIPLSVSTVKAIIFFFIDIPVLWAIQRGLLVLQAVFYISKYKRSDTTVRLARTRVPVVGAELLTGSIRLPNVFVLVHIGVLAALFVDTLGVEPGLKPASRRASFTNIMILSMPDRSTSVFINLPDGNTTAALSFIITSFEDRSCKTRNRTHGIFWPIAFNGSLRRTPEMNEWQENRASGEAEAPGIQPLFTLECILLPEKDSCTIDDLDGTFVIKVVPSSANATIVRPTEGTYIVYRQITVPREKNINIIPDLVESTGYAFEFHLGNRNWATCSAYLRGRDSRSWCTTGGWTNQSNGYV